MKKICLWVGIIISAIAIVFVSVGLVKNKTYNPQKPVATIEFEGYDKAVKIELDPQSAPNEVANFIKLANSGFYSNYKMDIKDGQIAGNKSNEKATLSNIIENPQENYIYGIKGDFLANNYDNLIKNKKGVITMLRNEYNYFGYTEEGYNSANAKFTILTEDNEGYDGYYAGFGRVVEGMDVVEAIAATRVEETDSDAGAKDAANETESDDTNVVVIKSISVDTFGVDYGTPEYNNYETTYNAVNSLCNQYFGSDYDSLFGN